MTGFTPESPILSNLKLRQPLEPRVHTIIAPLVKCFSFYISSYLYSLSVHTHPYSSILIYLPFLYAPIRTFPYTCVLETAFLSLLLDTSHVPIFLIMGIYVLLLPCHSASIDKFKKGKKCIYISMYV